MFTNLLSQRKIFITHYDQRFWWLISLWLYHYHNESQCSLPIFSRDFEGLCFNSISLSLWKNHWLPSWVWEGWKGRLSQNCLCMRESSPLQNFHVLGPSLILGFIIYVIYFGAQRSLTWKLPYQYLKPIRKLINHK